MTRGVRNATSRELPRLLAIQSVGLASGRPALLRAGIDGPPVVLVSGEPPAGYALAVGRTPTYLAELAVAPACRNAGHGSALLSTLLARGDECRVTTRADAKRARRFYERNGFRVAERLSGHYAGDDGVLLTRQPGSASAGSSSDRS